MILVAALLAMMGWRSSALAAPAARDVFTQLQENVWYLPTKDKAAQLYVTQIGRGPPVVFLHGGPGNDFNYIVDALRPWLGAFTFILFDQRGSLLSPVSPAATKSVTLDVLVADLETLRQALGEDKLILFGHSFGTLLAQAYYQKYPDHVAGMVLAASVPPKTPEGGFGALFKAAHARMNALRERSQIAAAVRTAGLPADPRSDTARQASDRWRITELAASNLAKPARWRSLQGGQVYYNEAVDDAVGDSIPAAFDLGPTIAAHPVPITVIDGDHDYLDPSAAGWRAQAAASPTIRRIVVPDAGHYAWIDNPDVFETALDAGLRAASRADGRK